MLQALEKAIPLLTVLDPAGLLTTLKGFIAETAGSKQDAGPPLVMPISLIPQMTTTAPREPLSERDTNVLSDLVSSMPELARATASPEGRSVLTEYLGCETAQAVIDFWEDEWVVE